MPANHEIWQQKLDQLASESKIREKQVLCSAQGATVDLDSGSYLNFASNDYLGLANDSRVIEVAQQAMLNCGVGSGASHMVIGHHAHHQELEQALSEFTGRDRALLFSTGYMANMAVCAAFCSSNSLILQDKLNHASLIDGARLSGARSQRFVHNDPASLEQQLLRLTQKNDYENIMILTDGVFSMDGDIAKLDRLSELASHYNAMLAVDDAHGIGVVGEGGAGCVELFGLSQSQCDLLIGTFGKAFGTSGAFVAGPKVLIDYLEQMARPHIYTTAFSPAIAAATLKSLSLIQNDSSRRERLTHNIAHFNRKASEAGLTLMDSETAIQGVLVGASDAVIKVGAYLKRQGYLTGVIRPPTVPAGSARLRITITAEHSQQQIDSLVNVLLEAKAEGLLCG